MNTRQAAHQFWWVDLWWPFLDCQQFEKSYKTISKQFEIYHSEVKTIIYKWKIFKTIANLSRSGCPTNTSQTQSQLNVEVHDSAIRKKIYKCCLFGRVAGRKPLLSKKKKKNMTGWLRFAKLQLNKPHDLWKSFQQMCPEWRCLAITHSATICKK